MGTAFLERARRRPNEKTQFDSGNLRCGHARGHDHPVSFRLRRKLRRRPWGRRYVQSYAYANPNANKALDLRGAGLPRRLLPGDVVLFTKTRINLSLCLLGLALLAAMPPSKHVAHIDVVQSRMTVSVYKEGIFSFAADNHEVAAPLIAGSYNDEDKSVEVTVDATRMQVQDPPSRRDQVQANMVGPDVLDVHKYPTIVFRSTQIRASDSSHWNVSGDLTLHGQTHPIDFDVTPTSATGFSGTAVIRQTNFGITPIKIAGGTVRVKDDVKVSFDVVFR